MSHVFRAFRTNLAAKIRRLRRRTFLSKVTEQARHPPTPPVTLFATIVETLSGVLVKLQTENLANMPGFAKMKGVAVGADGKADPQSQLFRSNAIGVETGPMISQVKFRFP